MTFIPIFNIPVFWPILVIYFMVWMVGGRDFTDVVYCDHAWPYYAHESLPLPSVVPWKEEVREGIREGKCSGRCCCFFSLFVARFLPMRSFIRKHRSVWKGIAWRPNTQFHKGHLFLQRNAQFLCELHQYSISTLALVPQNHSSYRVSTFDMSSRVVLAVALLFLTCSANQNVYVGMRSHRLDWRLGTLISKGARLGTNPYCFEGLFKELAAQVSTFRVQWGGIDRCQGREW